MTLTGCATGCVHVYDCPVVCCVCGGWRQLPWPAGLQSDARVYRICGLFIAMPAEEKEPVTVEAEQQWPHAHKIEFAKGAKCLNI